MDFSKKRVIHVTDLLLDEVQAVELKYALGIPYIFCFEDWEAEQQTKPNKLIPDFAAESKQKCNSCYILLCYGNYMSHDVYCLFNDLCGTLSLADIRIVFPTRLIF